ncbi:hypothetical protein ACFLQK_01020 [bacterium]
MKTSGIKLPGIRSQRGAALLIIFLLILAIAGIYSTIRAIKWSREQAVMAVEERRGLGVRCKKAFYEIRDAMEADKKLTGGYPYALDGEFLDKYKMLDRYVYNQEIWSPHANNMVELETSYGESYILIGYCRDGYIYTYDSIDDKLYTQKFILKRSDGGDS